MKKNKDLEIEKILNNILICLYIIIALVGLTLIIVISGFQNDSIDTSSVAAAVAETETEEEEIPYDVTGFDEMTMSQIADAMDTSEYKVIYVGREGCGYCKYFLSAMMEAQTEYNFRHIYLDTDKMEEEDWDNMFALTDLLDSTAFGTPTIIVTKDNAVVDVHVGYTEVETYISFLNSAGIN